MAIRKVFLRTAFNYDRDQASVESGIVNDAPSLTQQSQAEEADINTIVRRFGLTGTVPSGLRTPTYEDFEDIFDFQTAMNAINEANRSFMSIPAEIRKRFNNDPAEYVAFCSDEKNLDEMRKLGLAKPVEVVQTPPPMRVEVVKPEGNDESGK